MHTITLSVQNILSSFQKIKIKLYKTIILHIVWKGNMQIYLREISCKDGLVQDKLYDGHEATGSRATAGKVHNTAASLLLCYAQVICLQRVTSEYTILTFL
jgi:hypothetical protein